MLLDKKELTSAVLFFRKFIYKFQLFYTNYYRTLLLCLNFDSRTTCQPHWCVFNDTNAQTRPLLVNRALILYLQNKTGLHNVCVDKKDEC